MFTVGGKARESGRLKSRVHGQSSLWGYGAKPLKNGDLGFFLEAEFSDA